MPRPGVDVVITDAAPSGGTILDTGQGFMVGLAERGPTDSPLELRSLRAYERACGPRVGGPTAHDSARAFFTEGGGMLYFLRLAGPTAKAAEAEVGPLDVSASSVGTWGNSLTVGLEADTGLRGLALAAKSKTPAKRGKAATRADDEENGNGENGNGETAPNGMAALVRVVVRRSGAVVERSYLVDTAEAAIEWAASFSAYVSIAADDPSAALAVVAAKPLAGGVSNTNITPEIVGTTLDYFGSGLGPGQVAYPGATDNATHAAILDYVERTKRCALLDLVDGPDDLAIAADVMGLYRYSGSRFGQALVPRLRYPGPASSTTVLVPFSAVQMGVIARRDRETGNPNDPAAGDVAFTRARGLNREFTDDVREELNELGATLARERGRPAVTFTYGSRTCAGPDELVWKWFGGSRVVMAITHEGDDAAEHFVHRQIDPQGRLFLELRSALVGVCDRYYQLGALYGESAEDAYDVDTSDAVNTPETIAAGEIHAAIRLVTSPPGEWVLIEISKQLSVVAA